MSTYQDLFTYAYPIVSEDGVFFMEHKDGSVSCAVKWQGIDYESMPDEASLSQAMRSLYQFYIAAAQYNNLFLEQHLFRGFDPYWSEVYYEYGEKNFRADRNPEFAKRIRRELADHYSKFSRHNDIYTVFTIIPTGGVFSKRGVAGIESRRDQLYLIVNELIGYLPGDPEVLNIDQYHSLILRHNNPARVFDGRSISPFNYRFGACNSLIKPSIDRGCIKTQGINGDGYYHRVIALLDYPDAMQGWPSKLCRSNADNIHVVQITNALNTQHVNQKSAQEAERSAEAANMVGGEMVAGKIRDHASFRDFVQQHNLSIHANCYVIIVSEETPDAVKRRHSEICKWLRNSPETMIVTDDLEVELHYHRIATPGSGYRSPYLRPDHHWQVANMTPCFAQSHGDMSKPEMAFITSVGTLVGICQRQQSPHHSLAAAKTGSGKSVTMAAKISQLYPLGFNFYITEVGRSYEYLVKAFGGEYYVLNPETSVVSPLASYAEMNLIESSISEANSSSGDDDGDSQGVSAITTMRNCVLPIMLATSNLEAYSGRNHCESILDEVLGLMYSSLVVDGLEGPTLQTLLDSCNIVIQVMEGEEDHRMEYLQIMANNLSSFLSTSEGKVFKRADTLKFNSGLVGLDFGQIIHGNANNLAKYLLLFTATRLQQLSFVNPERTFMVFDEDHEYTNIDRGLMELLKSQVTKRGRKHAAYLYPISQVVEDIAYTADGKVNSGLINQFSNKFLLYYGTDHGDLPAIFNLPQRAADIWKSYPDPMAPGNFMNYRQGLFIQSGNFYDLHLTWPDILSAITNSNPDAIILKDRLLKEEGSDMGRVIDRFMQEYVDE